MDSLVDKMCLYRLPKLMKYWSSGTRNKVCI